MRRLSLNDVELAIEKPDRNERQRKGNHNGFVHKYFKTIDGRTLTVCAETYKGHCWILTAFYDSSQI